MLRHRRWLRLLALFLALGLVAAACGNDDDGGAVTPDGDQQEGGELVFGVEQWPECINPITSCYTASWTSWSVLTHVLPQALTLDAESNYVPSPVLAGEPEVIEDPFTVTFSIAEEAVWDDGTPITSEDFEFTWRAHLDTPGAAVSTGYDVIDNVDTTDPKSAVVTFTEPYAPWRDLFGGIDYLLPAHVFDSTDVSEVMNDNIPFSGHAWKLESWSEQEAVLVPNEAMWDEDLVPVLDRVVFVPREDPDTEITALLTDTDPVAAIYPQHAPGIAERIDVGNVDFVVGAGAFLEGLFPNHSRALGGNQAVREALLWAMDREAITQALFGDLNPGVLNCAGWSPAIGPWCDESDFGDVTQDFDRAEQILTDDGWTRGSDGVWEKDGQDLEIEWNTVAGNARREDVQQIVQEQVDDFGIRFNIQNFDAGELFSNRLPALNYGMFLAAQVGSPEPDQSVIYACNQIPSEENDFQGQNYSAYCNSDLDTLMAEANRTIDEEARIELFRQIGDLVREDVAWIPLYTLPNLVIWRTDQVGGPVGDFVSSPLGGFRNMYDWSVVS